MRSCCMNVDRGSWNGLATNCYRIYCRAGRQLTDAEDCRRSRRHPLPPPPSPRASHDQRHQAGQCSDRRSGSRPRLLDREDGLHRAHRSAVRRHAALDRAAHSVERYPSRALHHRRQQVSDWKVLGGLVLLRQCREDVRGALGEGRRVRRPAAEGRLGHGGDLQRPRRQQLRAVVALTNDSARAGVPSARYVDRMTPAERHGPLDPLDLLWFCQLAADGEFIGTEPERRPTLAYISSIVETAAEMGFSSLLTATNYHAENEAWTASIATLARTRGAGLLVAVRPGMFHPAIFAKMVATAENLFPGRVRINVVTGSNPAENAMYGDMESHADRYARTREFIAILRDLW